MKWVPSIGYNGHRWQLHASDGIIEGRILKINGRFEVSTFVGEMDDQRFSTMKEAAEWLVKKAITRGTGAL
jgi:hypothetical protein